MKVKNILKEDINRLSSKLNNALDNDNIQVAYNEMMSINEKIENLKKQYDLLNECKNFGIANMRVENSLPKLFIEDKKAIKEYLNLIKEDNNLSAQFQFINSLKNINPEKIDYKNYITECLNIAKQKINLKELNKSNDKIVNFIENKNISLDDEIDNNVKKLYESIHYILSNSQKFNNVIDFNENINYIADYIKEKDKNIKESKEYSNIKNECLNLINSLLEEENNKELNLLKDKIINTNCSEENIEKLKNILKILQK